MKRICLMLALPCLLWACNDSASVEVKIDSTTNKLEDKAEKVWDSTKEGARNLKEKVEKGLDKLDSAFDAKRDSLKKKKID